MDDRRYVTLNTLALRWRSIPSQHEQSGAVLGLSWSFDAATGAYATEPIQTVKTKKVPRNHVKAEATEKHSAQVDVYYEDVIVGYWRAVKFSGAMPAKQVNDMLERVGKLQQAVKFAREEANNLEVDDQKVDEKLFRYLFNL